MALETRNCPIHQDPVGRMLQAMSTRSQEQIVNAMVPTNATLFSVKDPLDTRSSSNSKMLSATSSIQVGNFVSQAKQRSVSPKKSRKAPKSSPSPSSKKRKVSGARSDGSSEKFDDVLAVSGIDLMKEEQALQPAPSAGIHDSVKTGQVVQEVEDRLFLEKIPLRLKLEQIVQKSGLKSSGKDVDLCLSLCTEHFLMGLVAKIIKMSNQRSGKEKGRHNMIVTSDVNQQIMLLKQKSSEELEKTQTEPGIFQNVKEANKGGTEKRSMKGTMNIDETNSAIRAALGDDDMLFRWKRLQSRQKNVSGLKAGCVLQPEKDADQKLSSTDNVRNEQEAEQSGNSAASTAPVEDAKAGQIDVSGRESSMARTISLKDVIAVLEREFQLLKSPLLYRFPLNSGGIPNIVQLPGKMVATVTGPDISRCRSLLSELEQKCTAWQKDHLDIITAAKAAQLMVDTLASCCEVGLIAGWDSGMSPALYRVDSTGILIKGEKLVSGSDVAHAYDVLNDVGDLAGEEEIDIPGIPLPPPLDMPFSCDRKYKDWSSWSGMVAAFWAKRVICDVASNSAEGLPLATVLLLGRFSGTIYVKSVYEGVNVTDFMDKNELWYSKPVRMGSFDDMTRGQGDTHLVT
ncbi:OLC1v1038817C1 [Oldenlandia corymbosa var. corymbosa]|uniref:OLC1v1038817C1 n=1 Tax=Oldenlandia corymbosa var. corymbosa TaxID=529605 RepID=A0AAV1D1M3_OLDCO|nr:OLC1v1038817C1 [Oldenlandia corymbosa var. corymbosa]